MARESLRTFKELTHTTTEAGKYTIIRVGRPAGLRVTSVRWQNSKSPPSFPYRNTNLTEDRHLVSVLQRSPELREAAMQCIRRASSLYAPQPSPKPAQLSAERDGHDPRILPCGGRWNVVCLKCSALSVHCPGGQLFPCLTWSADGTGIVGTPGCS